MGQRDGPLETPFACFPLPGRPPLYRLNMNSCYFPACLLFILALAPSSSFRIPFRVPAAVPPAHCATSPLMKGHRSNGQAPSQATSALYAATMSKEFTADNPMRVLIGEFK